MDETETIPYEAPIEIPLLDQRLGASFSPGLEQTQAVAVGVTRLVALGIREGTDAVIHNNAAATGVGLALDYGVAFLLPIPVTFSHEEWHIAALREGDVRGTDKFLSGQVVDVEDEALVRFKEQDPAGLVRAHSAGLEQQNAYVRQLSDEGFAYASSGWKIGPFETGRTFLAPHRQAVELNTFFYLQFCASERTDEVIATVEDLEPVESDRDFTGPDCTAWARDLLRPDEPYTARGPHPSGEGLGRYVGWSDLSEAERELLKSQVLLHLVDLVNPHLYGIERVRIGESYATGSLMHWLTPYGYAVDLHGGYRKSGPTFFGTARIGMSEARLMPSLGAEVRDWPLGGDVRLDADATAWLQPQDLRWGAPGRPGGALSARLRWDVEGRFAPYIGLRAKTAGWEPGIAALDEALYVTAGARLAAGRARAN